MRSLWPDKALQLPSSSRGFMWQRRPTSRPSQGGSCRLIAHGGIRSPLSQCLLIFGVKLNFRHSLKIRNRGSSLVVKQARSPYSSMQAIEV